MYYPTVEHELNIYHFFLFDNSTAMDEAFDGGHGETKFEFYKSEIGFLINTDKLSKSYWMYTVSDAVKKRFEKCTSRLKIF